MRSFYSFLLILATPLALLYLISRGLRSPDYFHRWGERFARFGASPRSGGIVVHAASMGEVNAASTLVRDLVLRWPDLPLCVTTLTPAGSTRVRALFGESVFHVYAPLDLPWVVRRFFDRVQPRLLIVMETELWPNLYHEAAGRDIPILIANARISGRSFGRYRRLRGLTSSVLGQVSSIGAQSEQDAARLLELGAAPARVSVTGNLKFDVRLPVGLAEEGEAIRRAWGTQRPVLLGGSTHEGDELPLLAAFARLLQPFPEALLVLAPRRPERFARTAQLARGAGLAVALRSDGIAFPAGTQCLVVDSLGELQTFYAACDVAFVGGSLEHHGGHNVLEAAALSRPVVVGPHTFNFEEITRQLVAQGAALRVGDAEELHTALLQLLTDADLRDRMGQSGLALVRSGQGAVERTLALAGELLTSAAG
ncbi:MAG: lipid IV(A) 3-deoxy-D-manno-octulosonic acid transferase [Lysobacterales bacterium]